MDVVASRAKNCLFLDVDGSLIDIAPRPGDVVVPISLVRDLDRLAEAFAGALALVSGRAIGQLDVLFAPWRFRASGVHGAQMRYDPHGPIVESAEAIPGVVWRDLGAVLGGFPGTMVENKTYSHAVHYRAVPAAGPALEAALSALLDTHAVLGLRLLPGHYVYEIKGAGFDKGWAVRRFMHDPLFAGREPIFIGDDVTDQPGFAAAIQAGGRAFAVSRDIPGTSGTFASPSAVREWLASLARKENMPA